MILELNWNNERSRIGDEAQSRGDIVQISSGAYRHCLTQKFICSSSLRAGIGNRSLERKGRTWRRSQTEIFPGYQLGVLTKKFRVVTKRVDISE